MNRFFNTAGPVKSDIHYQIDPLTRLDWAEVQMLIAQQKYLVLHAPRQTGKTTTLLAMMQALNQAGDYSVLYANIEGAQVARNDIERGIKAVCQAIVSRATDHDIAPALKEIYQKQVIHESAENALTSLLTQWAMISEKPCVLLLDEVDALVGDTLISVLRQIRAGYDQRPRRFPVSIVLCGVRDVRDYRIHSGGEIIAGGSAFNIKSKSLRMGSFNPTELRLLFQQHTDTTGQLFDETLFAALWQDTQGQPWLVNALGYEMAWEAKEKRDRTQSIELEDYNAARERLIQSRSTHLDQLSDKLSEPRVHSVIAPMLATNITMVNENTPLDDLQYVEDLGLITLKPQLRISNRIYQEVIPRELTYPTQIKISHQQSWYLDADNHINMPKLLSAFQQFFRENSQVWLERFDYKEAGPQLLMQAFLQRIVNGGGRRGSQANAWSLCTSEVEPRMATGCATGTFRTQNSDQPSHYSGRINREYALGSTRTDLLIEWPTTDKGFYGHVQRIVIELKILYGALDTDINKGLRQTADYADKLGASQAHLMIFNRSPDMTWQDKIWQREANHESRKITVWGC
ncbi:MAG: type II secretory pathway predicted ATPase ExeA [Phenylobacterium sp.]|jgi:type II secretory pathway predicted ATPase ExeA